VAACGFVSLYRGNPVWKLMIADESGRGSSVGITSELGSVSASPSFIEYRTEISRWGMTTRDTPWPDGTPCWADLGALDVAKAREFYSDIFNWTVQPGGPETGGYSVAELNGRGVAGIGPKMGPPEAPTMWMTYLATPDADVTAARIKGAGGQLVMEPMDIMDARRMAVAVDTAGFGEVSEPSP
jgi:predicted enzyme related to lactoylglutathione lyase